MIGTIRMLAQCSQLGGGLFGLCIQVGNFF